MFDDDRGRLLYTVTILVLAVFFGGWYAVAEYNECRRIHPTWYCLGQAGK